MDWSTLFDFSDYGELLVLVQNSIYAGAVLGVVGGLIGVFVMTRDMAFAVHGISELSFAGAANADVVGAHTTPSGRSATPTGRVTSPLDAVSVT